MKPMMVYLLLSLVSLSTVVQAKPVDLTFRLKERVSMEELANLVLNPASPRYGKYFTPEEIRTLAAPSDQEYEKLLRALSHLGMQIIQETKTHLILTARTEQAVAARNFLGVTRNSELVLIESVTGFDSTRRMRSHLKVSPFQKLAAVSQADIKKGYGFDPVYKSGITGKGQDLAIATYDGFHMDDITAFFQKSKISPAPVVDQVKFNGTPKVDENSAAETELDAEFSGMIANGAKIHIFASAENSDAGELAMFTAILDDNRAKVVNYSWGTCEAQTEVKHKNDMDQLYARAIAQGVNIVVASGDNGSDGCRDGTKDADWPASAPSVVAVGGTSFALSGSKLSETAWAGSGGGVSKFYPLPSYQGNFQSPYQMRSFPDVAFNADQHTGEQIWTQYQTGTPHWMTIGGTSMAAPQWSGFLALVGEARTKAGKTPIGFLNPILYSLSASDRARVLHDIEKGDNGYPAGVGWDAVTGLGSMQADALLDYLVKH